MSKSKVAALLASSVLLLTGCSTATLSGTANDTTSAKPKLTPQEIAAYKAVLLYPIPRNHETIEDFLQTLGNDVGDTVYLRPYTFGDTVIVQIRFDHDFDIDFAYQNGKVEPADQVSQALLQGDVGQAFTDAMSAYESAQQADNNNDGGYPIFLPMWIGGGYGGTSSYSGVYRYSGSGRVSTSSDESTSSSTDGDGDAGR
ncbi:hypothetical protein [Alicyclobacillus acidocaldarius]|uniref:Lipoprotein n=2 Tax=Alicyclobacillus TaxID=29330 RepID=C8WSV5_ALIAD|nr:hypothetical protein [Alicyclobacillus acidocaldarius]ACV57611.1 hypothetical protein Aaci_0562 [Alicyclobacillus acidocaldarius subsp. acidocaldarius DSM 446]ACV60099.1 hypothetical protein Aaci_3103 [Alicyclobacillus acidocaldarius subsp. acidocaldarius DSM 446]